MHFGGGDQGSHYWCRSSAAITARCARVGAAPHRHRTLSPLSFRSLCRLVGDPIVALVVPEPAAVRSGRSSGRGVICGAGCDDCRPGGLADAGVPANAGATWSDAATVIAVTVVGR